jgi:hypothetical protein
MRAVSGIALLEIGVWQGHSLAMWNEYFEKATIVGLDIAPSRCLFDVDVRECDATNAEQIQSVLGDSTYDYIIDDGSHRVEDQVRSLELLWDRLNGGGKYFVEDIAGDGELQTILSSLKPDQQLHHVYDLRANKGRYDDIMLVVTK